MRKIIVAGAGHGGLTAAINLAKNGCDVTVIEAKERDIMGHDWCDYLGLDAFDESGIDRPAEGEYKCGMQQGYRNPSRTVLLKPQITEKSIIMDRKVLIKNLISQAEKAGVKFVFGKKVSRAIVQGEVVMGILCEDGEEMRGDLVIDACGMYSPVRMSLPEVCGVQKEIEEKDVFHVYRAYFKTDGTVTDQPYMNDFFHMYKPGIDWTITEEDYVDILIGKFGMSGALTQEEVDLSLADYRHQYPFISRELVRGGSFADIPLTKTIPMIICDGYAAVGDSAGMTVPLNGSGIILSMKAGKLLADAVLTAYGPMTKYALWPYQYEYFQRHGYNLITINTLRSFFTYIDSKDVDYFCEHGILNEENLQLGGGDGLEITPKFLAHVLSVSLPLLGLAPPLLKTFKGKPVQPVVSRIMPKMYDEKKVETWRKLYEVI